LAGIAYLKVKKLTRLGESDWQVVFYFTLICSLVTGGWMLLDTFSPVTLDNVSLLLGVGITATLAQLAMTRAYRTGKTLVVGALAYSTVVFSSLWGILFWSDVLPLVAWLGMGMIVVSGLLCLSVSPSVRD
jgi:S-adenosylmethionine uptake transporter